MKYPDFLLFCCLLLSVGQVVAQSKPLCDCARVAAEERVLKAYSDTRAQQEINTFCALFQHPAKIYAKSYACIDPIYAKVCETDERKYIFYTNEFMDGLFSGTKWGDRFVLAHEISHHLLGHTERAYRLSKMLRTPNPLDTLYAKFKEKNTKTKVVSIPQRHLHELEADALALWMVVKRHATREDMQAIFGALPTLLTLAYKTGNSNGQYNPDVSTDLHPSLFIRKQLIERYWGKFENRAADKRYAVIGDDDDDSYRILEKDTEEFYAFQLLSASEEQQFQLNQVERNIRDSLSRRSWFSVDVVVGGQVQVPVLRRNGTPVAATYARSPVGGIRLTVGPWYRATRFETDFKLTSSSFATRAELSDGLRTIEQFNTTYLYVQPRYVHSWMNRLARYTYRTSGPMITAGLSASIPLHYTYKNYVATNYKTIPQQVGVTGIVGVGYGLSNWISRNGHFRLWLLYQPQPLKLASSVNEPVSAWLHTFSLDFSCRFW